MRILYFLPARSGSKGVKDKNIKDLHGKPLMAYMIQAIQNSQYYHADQDYIMLNTDSEEYARIGEQYGSVTPFLRPPELSTDTASITDTIIHTINYFEEKKMNFDFFAFLQVTAPLITGKDIDKGIEILLEQPEIDTVNSVTEVDVSPLWCNTLEEDGRMDCFLSEEVKRKNRQELPTYYKITGAVRIARWNRLKENQFDWYKNSKALRLEPSHSMDIDTMDDFLYAQYLMERRNKKC
ncbi:acylneuraminate cytidylyltransferase family protein [Anaeromicropila populeti]|uniref:N-acylneuraminate cytidylyltransferase n=1 Tax=Anaeromicropila populeti TaxID=37658 RepID=A0A1I6HWC2_9FIRM|nr:acylneuraminate cytidylyltransferase family protein [Anaeromicropila populeti]SFR58698.1 N-acylneuraminate cytidylyltransferase [Anaeromicropila populeti]